MSWQTDYRSKLTTPERALEPLPGDAMIYLSGNAATPRTLCAALARHAEDTPGTVTVGHVLLLGKDPVLPHDREEVRHRAWFVGPADRDQVNQGISDYVPSHLSEIPRLIRAMPRLDGALLTVAPPDDHGFLSLGVEVMASLAAAERAQRVVVQVNPRMPRIFGNSFLHVSEVDAIVEAEEDLATIPREVPGDVEQAIARHIVPLIPEQATLQLGIGGIPDAVVAQLQGRDDLGVHSEMISDGVMDAVMRGVVTGRHKPLHRRKVVTTFVLGTRELYDWVDGNPAIEAHPCDHTNDLVVASSMPRLVAINSAISVDLTGQVNSDSMGTAIWSGVGGQLDFLRAAARSAGGVPIIALPSTAKGGTISRIVPTLRPGAGVVTTRADVHWVVTEHGAVNLYGRPLHERAELLVSIAEPRFRDELMAAFRARFSR
ncbi:MAG: acetyl-CoA hydrolase/transferase family protein [Alphaproteobacteria bacterium]|nr:acetyl-CoA hydrolase/transferase family protein [Alphaproteobacteria bacterium]